MARPLRGLRHLRRPHLLFATRKDRFAVFSRTVGEVRDVSEASEASDVGEMGEARD
jgi:hypothetical protein